MEKKTLTFRADNQILVGQNVPARFASDTVSYIEAVFDLGENWSGFDAVKAVWSTDFESVCTVLDSSGACVVPYEVLERVGDVWVNLVGSISEDEILTDRLTTYPAKAITVDANATVCGSETSPITPSQFDQFAAAVRADADRAEAGATAAAASASSAAASATSASGSATDASQSANGAAQAAQSASESADSAERSAQSASDSAADAEEAKNAILNMTATATTLPEGSEATVDYSNGVMAFGIPKGDTGARGAKGDTGETGATPNLSIGTVETLAPDEDATATITGTAEEPVLNLGIPKGDTGDVNLSQLEALLPTDTASGSIVTITDGTDLVPAKSLKVTLEPIQDLNGYDKPWAGGAGKNKFNPTPYAAYLQSDGTYKLTGAQATAISVNIPASMVGVSCCYSVKFNLANSGTLNWMRTRAYINGSYINGSQIANGNVGTSFVNFTPVSTDDCIYVEYGSGGGNNIIMSELQLEAGSTATDYEPYSNICPISGHTECVTERTGVNVWDEEWESGYINNSTGENVASVSQIRGKNFIPTIPNATYYFKSPSGLFVYFYDANKGYIGVYGSGTRIRNGTITLGDDVRYIRVSMPSDYGTTYNHDISINYPSTDTDYHAYQGTTYTTTLGRTVYGGTVDLVSGVLTVDKRLTEIASFSGTFGQRANGYCVFKSLSDRRFSRDSISNMFIRSEEPVDTMPIGTFQGSSGAFTTWSFMLPSTITSLAEANAWLANLPETLVVTETLVTPQTIQLTPQDIALLTGDNNVWSDGGSIEVKYRANIGLYVDKKISEVNA